MNRFAQRFKIESSRLIGWNYSENGVYFITICTMYQNNFLGKIVEGKMIYKVAGEICKAELLKTFELRKNLKLIAWVIMPNHVHILFSVGDFPVETPGLASLPDDHKQIPVISNYKNHPKFFKNIGTKSKQIVPATIQQFKSSVKRKCNQQKLFFVWQDRYYDEVIKDEKRSKIIKYYIKNNPKNWERDSFYKV